MKRITTIFFICILLISTNCAKIFRKPEITLDNITIHQIREQVEQNHWKLSTIKGRAHVSIETPKMGMTTNGEIILKMPDMLAIKLRASFGIGVGSISVDKDSFTVYSPMENIAYSGDVDSVDLRQFFQLNLKFKDLLNVVSGIPIITEIENIKLAINDNKYLISVKNENYSKKYWIDPKKFVVTDLLIFDKNGELFVKQEFRQFRKDKGVYLPAIIRVNHPKRKDRITVMYTDRKTNKKTKKEDFHIKIPQKTERIFL